MPLQDWLDCATVATVAGVAVARPQNEESDSRRATITAGVATVTVATPATDRGAAARSLRRAALAPGGVRGTEHEALAPGGTTGRPGARRCALRSLLARWRPTGRRTGREWLEKAEVLQAEVVALEGPRSGPKSGGCLLPSGPAPD